MTDNTALYTEDYTETIRNILVQQGRFDCNLIVNGFDNTATMLTPDGRASLTTFPVPDGAMVHCEIKGAAYLKDVNGSVDSGAAFSFSCAGFRLTGSDVKDIEGVGGALEILENHIELNSTDSASASTVTFAATANTTNQGINITVANDAATENGYLFARMSLTCALEDGMKQPYYS